jgi:hypothetical protein
MSSTTRSSITPQVSFYQTYILQERTNVVGPETGNVQQPVVHREVTQDMNPRYVPQLAFSHASFELKVSLRPSPSFSLVSIYMLKSQDLHGWTWNVAHRVGTDMIGRRQDLRSENEWPTAGRG